MWLITTKGIYSVVAHRDDPDQLLVRSRSEKDIDYFRSVMADLDLEPLSDKVYGDNFDYPWRYYCLREDVEKVFAELADRIGYTNFKSAAPAERSKVLMDVYYDLMSVDDREKQSAIGKGRGFYSFAASHSAEGATDEEEQLMDRVQELEIALENAAYVIEGQGPVKSRRGKLKLVDALIRQGLWGEEPDQEKLRRQLELVERDAEEV